MISYFYKFIHWWNTRWAHARVRISILQLTKINYYIEWIMNYENSNTVSCIIINYLNPLFFSKTGRFGSLNANWPRENATPNSYP